MQTKEQHRKNNLRLYHKRRVKLIEQLGGKCAICGSTENLEFDHIDSSSKEIKIGECMSYDINLIQKELSKCQLLCKKCHIEKTKLNKDSNARISYEEAKNIRSDYINLDITQKQLGKKYNLKQREISYILRGKRWCQKDEDKDIQEKINKKAEKNKNITQYRGKPVDKIDIETGEIIKTYDCMIYAVKEGFNINRISKCCKGTAKTHGGYRWQFHKDNESKEN